MAETLRKPSWWSPDVEFDITGKTQLEWAKAGAAEYRELHPERYGASPAASPSVTKSVTSGKKSVTSVTPERHSVTESVTESVTKKDKTAERTRRWREKQRGASDELS